MVHLVTQRNGYDLQRARSAALADGGLVAEASWRQSSLSQALFELFYILTLLTFLAGSVLFLPQYERYIDLGCQLYIVGSVVLAALAGYEALLLIRRVLIDDAPRAACAKAEFSGAGEALEAGELKKSLSLMGLPARELSAEFLTAERQADLEDLCMHLLYFFGSVVFAVGSFFWEHPAAVAHNVQREEVLMWGIVMFMVGSAAFVFAAFVNALTLHYKHPDFTAWAVATCSCYEMGGVFFVAGSVCFMPGVGCDTVMIELGGWAYIIGSFMYVLGATIAFMKTMVIMLLEREADEETQQLAGNPVDGPVLPESVILKEAVKEEVLNMLSRVPSLEVSEQGQQGAEYMPEVLISCADQIAEVAVGRQPTLPSRNRAGTFVRQASLVTHQKSQGFFHDFARAVERQMSGSIRSYTEFHL
eukprot:TRINITY_DN81368_c0_g1_i1.p1 TRINITY_DN81368_c0_g1~~TRINITY_DN81368_c0_g1_i1.p1  ORF type:complete len:440 (+),score=82.05 TRINITY_DN81368_c0_g1_i1:68-1321(+)